MLIGELQCTVLLLTNVSDILTELHALITDNMSRNKLIQTKLLSIS